METKEIFAKLKARMLEGMVFHDEMSRYYDFLALAKQKRCHEHHYAEETDSYKNLCSYYMRCYNSLIPTEAMARPDVIPESWYNYARVDVDSSTKKNGIKSACEKWIAWETETKLLFEDMYAELLENGDTASALFIEQYICDVNEELADAKEKHLEYESVGYDLAYINS